MSYSVTIQLSFNRYDVGPFGPFDLYSNVDSYTTPFETCITRAQLVGSGYVSQLVPEGTATIRIKTNCVDCDTYIDVNLITPSPTPTQTVTPSISVTNTPSISATPSLTPTKTPTKTPTATPSVSVSLTPTVTPSISISVTPTVTVSITPSVTATVTVTPSKTATPSVTVTPFLSPTPTPSITPSLSVSLTVTPSISITPTVTPSMPPQPIAGTRLANSSAESCYAPVVPIYTFDGQVLPGYTLYTNPQLTINITGYNHVKLDNGIIYTLNSITGVVGNDTGNRCKGNIQG